ncbi:hypothetical protein H0H87_002963, partial [Tephrocybe sp. NHM501043]
MEEQSPRVAQELADLIIDQLRNDPYTLSQCSLVSSQWLVRSKMWLFRDLKLTLKCYHHKRDYNARLIETFANPESKLAPLVRSLIIVGPDDDIPLQ